MSNRIAILVEGIDDPALVIEIEKTIRDSFEEMALPGSWRVTARPSHVSGHWDFTVHGLDARQTQSIAVPLDMLSRVIPRRLEESLNVCGSTRLKTTSPERSSLPAA